MKIDLGLVFAIAAAVFAEKWIVSPLLGPAVQDLVNGGSNG